MTTTKKLAFNPVYGINAKAHRRENNFLNEFCLISFEKGEFKEVATLRVYGTNAKNYACLWIGGEFKGYAGYISASGSGSAGGYGYHRPSAAAADAFKSAGVGLPFDISGRGESAINDALNALAKHLKLKNYTIHYAHA
jgi:hypothetical protein